LRLRSIRNLLDFVEGHGIIAAVVQAGDGSKAIVLYPETSGGQTSILYSRFDLQNLVNNSHFQPLQPSGGRSVALPFGKGFSSGAATVRLDRKTSMTPPGQTTAANINSTVISDSEIDATIDAGFLFTPHIYSLDVQVSGGQAGTSSSNSVNLYAVSVTPLAGKTLGCTTTATFPQGPEAVAIDPTLHIALVTNFACNSVSVIAVMMTAIVVPSGRVIWSR